MKNRNNILIETTRKISMELNKNHKDMLIRLGKNIADRRRQSGKTQAEIAEIINIDALSVSRIERGAITPSLHTLGKIALALETPLPALFTGASTSIESIADGILSMMESLLQKHRIFLYHQIEEWCEHLHDEDSSTPSE